MVRSKVAEKQRIALRRRRTELLGQILGRVPNSGGLDGPDGLIERLWPIQTESAGLLLRGPDGDGAQLGFVTADSHRRVGRLLWVDTNDDVYEYLLVRRLGLADLEASRYEPTAGLAAPQAPRPVLEALGGWCLMGCPDR